MALDIQRLGHGGRGSRPGRLRHHGGYRQLPLASRPRQEWALHADDGAALSIRQQDRGLLHRPHSGCGDGQIHRRRSRLQEGLRPHVPGAAGADADADPNSGPQHSRHGNACAYCDAHPDGDAYCDAHRDGDAYSHAHAYSDPNSRYGDAGRLLRGGRRGRGDRTRGGHARRPHRRVRVSAGPAGGRRQLP